MSLDVLVRYARDEMYWAACGHTEERVEVGRKREGELDLG